MSVLGVDIDFTIYLELAVSAAIPVVLSVAFYLLEKYTGFKKWNKWLKQIIIGIFFGAAAIYGTEFGVPINGAQVNARDAAVLCAGLIFGGPAGIIAGLIGGIERWFAVYWGIGAYTRIACSVSTMIAGFYAAGLRKLMFDNKKPAPAVSLFAGLVMEVFHMMMVFITHLDAPQEAFAVVQKCTLPMVIVNSISVFVAVLLISLIAREKMVRHGEKAQITQKVQNSLLIAVVIAFAITIAFTFALQEGLSQQDTKRDLQTNVEDVKNEITKASDDNILTAARQAVRGIDLYMHDRTLDYVADQYNISEISVVNNRGIIVVSTNRNYVGFDMNSGEQAAEFMCLARKECEEFVQEYQPITKDGSTQMKYAGIRISGGFAQFGYDETRFQNDIAHIVADMTVNRHIGESGYLIIADKKGNIVSDPYEAYTGRNIGTVIGKGVAKLKNQEPNMMFQITSEGVDYDTMYCEHEGYFIIALIPVSQATQARDLAIYMLSFIEVLLFGLLYAVIYFIIKKLVVKNIDKINDSLAEITNGNLEEKVEVRDTREFASLSDDINSTVDKLKQYIAEAAARIDAELQMAKNIQSSSLPSVFPPFPDRKEIDLFASMNTAKEVGGDFYDFYWTDENHLAVLIADVSGKGIPAALFMMRAKTMIKNFMETGHSPAEAFTKANAGLCEGNDAEMFVTAWLGLIDVTTGHVEFANAGHNPPVVKHANGEFEYLKSRAGFVLAGMDGIKYKQQEFDIEPDAILYLYTDGVTEATDANNELYGEDRLLKCLNGHMGVTMETLCKGVSTDIDLFVKEADQFDDITMVAVKLVAEDGKMNEMTVDATIENIPMITEWIDGQLEEIGCSMKAQMQIDVAIDELFSNIALYAYNPDVGPATVRVEVADNPTSVIITFLDHGVPYDPLAKEDPDITLSAEERGIGGLGIFMVKKTMDDVKYEYRDGQNILMIKKNLE